MNGKRLVVTADDAGLHPSIDDGIIEACRDGVVSAVSLVANGRNFEAMVDALRALRTVDVGAHLTFVEERPLLDPADVPTLVGEDGNFHRNWKRFVLRYLRGAIDLGELRAELESQLDRIARTGLAIRFVNSHQHLHVLPGIAALVLDLANSRSIPFVRSPVDRGSRTRLLPTFLLGLLGRHFRSSASAAGFVTNDATIGIADAGHIDEEIADRLLGHVTGVTEMVAHPGRGTVEISQTYDWGFDWDSERRVLTGGRFAAEAAERGIALTSFLRLAAPPATSE